MMNDFTGRWHWWDDTDGGKRPSETNLSQSQFIHHNSQPPGTEKGPTLRGRRQTAWAITRPPCTLLLVLGGGASSASRSGRLTSGIRALDVFYTGCPRRNVGDFGRVFLMLNYTDITQNTYIQSWTVTEIMAIEKCGFLRCPCTVRRPWRHTHPLRMPGNEIPLANIVMQWPWRDNATAAACVK